MSHILETWHVVYLLIFYDIYGLLNKCEIKMARNWPSYFLFTCLWTSTSSRSINSQKKNEANTQPS